MSVCRYVAESACGVRVGSCVVRVVGACVLVLGCPRQCPRQGEVSAACPRRVRGMSAAQGGEHHPLYLKHMMCHEGSHTNGES